MIHFFEIENMKRWVFTIWNLPVLLTVGFCCPLLAGTGDSTPVHFFRLDLSHGLSHQTVYAIHQDRRGYIWFCTENGLDRFDGYNFKNYQHDPSNQRGLADDNINSIMEDENGLLWLGTWGGGLNRFDPRTGQSVAYKLDKDAEHSLNSDYIQCIVEGRNGILWIGTYNGGLNRFDRSSGAITSFSTNDLDPGSISSNRIWCIFEDERGRLWLGTDQGLNIFDPDSGTFRLLDPPGQAPFALAKSQVRTFAKSASGDLWVGTNRGIARVDTADETASNYFLSEGGNSISKGVIINAIHENSAEELWIGTLGNGLQRLNPRNGEVDTFLYDAADPFSISGNDIRSLKKDRSGNLWIGIRGGGINRVDLKPAKFRLYSYKNLEQGAFPSGEIRCITSDSKDNLWIGFQSDGMIMFDRKNNRLTAFNHDADNPNSLSHNRVLALTVDRKDVLWVGTYDGLNRQQPDGGFERIDVGEHDLADNRINALLVDSRNHLWIGTQSGLARFQDGRMTSYHHDADNPNSLSNGRVNCLFEDSSGTIWIGLGPSGLNRFRPESDDFQTYGRSPQDPVGLSDNACLSLAEMRGGLWIGTLGGGLLRLDLKNGSFKTYTQAEGLPNNVIHGLLPGQRDQLWLSTNKGLSRLDLRTETFRNYDVYDGLQSNQFSIGAYHQTASGEMLFGGISGINAFHPAEVNDHYYIPPVVISSFEVMDVERHRNLLDGSEIVLEADQNYIAFDFAALDYTRSEKNRYAYYLEGLENDWNYPQELVTTASYTNLDPGRYTFRVKGANHDGIWNETGASIVLTITPTVWHSLVKPGIAILGVVLFILMAFYVHKYQKLQRAEMSSLRRSQQMAVESNKAKSAFLAHISHELRTPLNAIIGFSELLEEDLADFDPARFQPEQCRADIAKIKSSAYQQLTQVNNLLELTKLETGKGELYLETFDTRTMVQTVLHHIHPMLEKSGNRLEVRFMPEDIGEMTADFMKVQGILINLLCNAIKFTKKGSITLSVLRKSDQKTAEVCFQVTDTGIGMSARQMGGLFSGFSLEPSEGKDAGGLGLYISDKFSKMMGGEIGVESQLSKGTTFSVRLPAVVAKTS